MRKTITQNTIDLSKINRSWSNEINAICAMYLLINEVGNWWLNHWSLMTYICVSKLTIIAVYNGLSSGRRQAFIWTIAGILSIGPLRTNFSEIFIEIHILSFKKMHLKCRLGNVEHFVSVSLYPIVYYLMFVHVGLDNPQIERSSGHPS